MLAETFRVHGRTRGVGHSCVSIRESLVAVAFRTFGRTGVFIPRGTALGRPPARVLDSQTCGQRYAARSLCLGKGDWCYGQQNREHEKAHLRNGSTEPEPAGCYVERP